MEVAMPSDQPTRFLRYGDLKTAKGVPFSRQHLYKLMAAGLFPQAIYLGKQTKGWVEAEVDKWLTDKIAERDTAA
jgi:prophage regulatory protein